MPFLDWIFPPRCLACASYLEKARDLCPHCESRWPSVLSPYFVPLGECYCRRVYAAGIYRGLLHDLIVRLKYSKEERLARILADRMVRALDEEKTYDLILPIPLHVSRLRDRGFNQAVLLARRVGKRRRILVDAFLLEKKRSTPPQAGLHRNERQKNLKGVFQLRDVAAVKDRKILIVDDVYTTGATIEAVAGLLVKAGAEEVAALVAARTE